MGEVVYIDVFDVVVKAVVKVMVNLVVKVVVVARDVIYSSSHHIHIPM